MTVFPEKRNFSFGFPFTPYTGIGSIPIVFFHDSSTFKSQGPLWVTWLKNQPNSIKTFEVFMAGKMTNFLVIRVDNKEANSTFFQLNVFY